MAAPYHQRFADALRDILPDGFTADADRYLATASYGTAMLAAPLPRGADRRKPVTAADARDWVEREAARLRRSMQHYTPEARAASEALLAALDRRGL